MKKTKKSIYSLFRYLWQRETAYILIIVGIFTVVIGLLTLIPIEAAETEIQTVRLSDSLGTIFSNPLDGLYKLLVFTATSIVPSIRAVRAVSFIFLLVTCIAMFYALKHWHSIQTSLMTTIAFGTNAIVLALARYGTPLITLMGFFVFASLLLWQLHSRSNKAVPMLVIIAGGLLMYTPGAPWFATILAIVFWDRIKPFFKNVKRQALLAGSLIALIAMLPLLWRFFGDFDAIRQWLLLPAKLELSALPRNILRVPSAFIYRMPIDPHINIARLPIFDLACGIFFLVGLNAYRHKLRLDRTRIMLGSALVGILLGALGSTIVAIVFLLPFAYSIVAAGIEYLLDVWYSVFPRNPIARSFGTLILTTAILFSTYYQLTRFFVVWPQVPETREAYTQSRLLDSR